MPVIIRFFYLLQWAHCNPRNTNWFLSLPQAVSDAFRMNLEAAIITFKSNRSTQIAPMETGGVLRPNNMNQDKAWNHYILFKGRILFSLRSSIWLLKVLSFMLTYKVSTKIMPDIFQFYPQIFLCSRYRYYYIIQMLADVVRLLNE